MYLTDCNYAFYFSNVELYAFRHPSGFTGSFGLVIITSKAAFLWTDGRYFLQASQELTEQWTLMKMGEPNVPTLIEWLALPHEDILPNEAKV